MQYLPAMAYATNLLLIVCAWHFPRLRTYAAIHLAFDLARLGLSFAHAGVEPYVGLDKAVMTLDNAMFLADVAVLAHVARVPWLPVVGFMGTMLAYAIGTYPDMHGTRLESFYVLAILVAHTYVAIAAAVAVLLRRDIDADMVMILGLVATGFVGAVIALAWPARWELVQAGNVLAFVVTCAFCIMFRKLDKRSKRPL